MEVLPSPSRPQIAQVPGHSRRRQPRSAGRQFCGFFLKRGRSQRAGFCVTPMLFLVFCWFGVCVCCVDFGGGEASPCA